MTLVSLLYNSLLYAAVGIFSGLISGLMGIGGGIVVVPSLIFLFQQNQVVPHELIMPIAIGSSLAVMIFTAQATLRVHYQMHNIAWNLYKNLAPGIILGTICGALLADKLPTQWLKILLAIFLLFIALRMTFEIYHKTRSSHSSPKFWVDKMMSFFIGCQSGLLGIGGGALVIPYLNYYGVELKKITPISTLCTTTVAIIGTITFIIIGSFNRELPSYSSGFIYWPAVLGIGVTSIIFAPIGAKMTYILPTKYLKYFFVVLLIVTSFELLIMHSP